MAIIMIAIALFSTNVWADEVDTELIYDNTEKSDHYFRVLERADKDAIYCNDSRVYVTCEFSDDFKKEYDALGYSSEGSFVGTAMILNLETNIEYWVSFKYDRNKKQAYFDLTYFGDTVQGGDYVVNSIYIVTSPAISYRRNLDEDGIFTNDSGTKTKCTKLDKDINFTVKEVPVITKFEVIGDSVLTENNDIVFDLDITTDEINLVTVCVRNVLTGEKYGPLAIYTGGDGYSLSYSQLGKNASMGEYKITDIWINPSRSYTYDDSPYAWYGPSSANNSWKYSSSNCPDGPLTFSVRFSNKKNNQGVKTIDLTSFKLKQTSAKLNENVFVDYVIDRPVREAMLVFDNVDGEGSMIVTLTNTNELPYFTVPFTTSSGTYRLNYLILKDNDDNETQYRSGDEYEGIKHFDFDCEITIEDEFVGTDLLHLENDKITDTVIQKVKDFQDNIVFELNANVDSFISQKMFEAIQGSNKTLVINYGDVQWVFNGRDIKEAKEIDARVHVYGTANDELYNGAVKKGLTLDFANNGTLPGKCLIRVDNSDLVKQYLASKKTYVYFYNTDTQKMEKVAMQVMLTNNAFYEFYISHNSTYVMTTEEIPDEYIEKESTKSEDLALNGGEKKSLLPTMQLYSDNGELDINTIIKISIGIVCAIILIIVMSGTVFYKRKEKDKRD